MAYAILRTAKLKTAGNIGGSLSHNYRTRETPNADGEREYLNRHSMGTAEEVKQAIEARLPEKRRSDAVLCIEYFIGASPEYFDEMGDRDGSRYFETAKKWLEDKHGKENVIATSVHMDETSPHLVAYVVPIDQETGNLSARKFLGGKATLSAMQSDFAETVKHHGLDRGIEGSKATHTTIQEYYSTINRTEPKPEITVPKPKLLETSGKYGERVKNEVLEQVNPKFNELNAKSNLAELSKKEAKEARQTLEKFQDDVRPLIDILRPLDRDQRGQLVEIMKLESAKLVEEKNRQKQAELEAKKIAQTQRKRSFSNAKTLNDRKTRGQGR